MIEGKIRVLRDKILVVDMNFGDQISSGGIVLPSDDGKIEGIKPRWCKVWAIGPEQKEVEIDEWILVEHGRWSRGFQVKENDQILTVRHIDMAGILVISDVPY